MAAAELLAAGVVHGTVYPDLPPAATLRQLLPALAAGKAGGGDGRRVVPDEAGAAPGGWQVRTVAAQLKGPRRLRRQMEGAGATAAAASDAAAGALLLVSGGHPVRRLPLARHLLPADSLALLREGHRLRRDGLLPPVENPLAAGSLDRLQRKCGTPAALHQIAAGAEGFILQPALLPARFSKWWHAAESKGLLDVARPIVGVPLISSARNFEFWLSLTDARGEEAETLLAEYRCAEERVVKCDEAFAELRERWFCDALRFVQDLPGAVGMHLMPVSVRGWRDFARYTAKGLL
eukprot:SM000009S23583  [mRNA]  locus=s9:810615:813152:- [translate_table: standard]